MLKRKFSKLFLVLGVILFNITIVSCDDKGGNKIMGNTISAYYSRTHFSENDLEGDYAIIHNYNELTSIFTSNIPEKYDDNYFKSNGLIIFKIIESSQGTKSEIISYSIENDTITIDVKTITYGEDCAMGYWYFILEINSEELANIKQVIILKNGNQIEGKLIQSDESKMTIEISNLIKEIYSEKINNESKNHISADDVNILHYIGKYGNSYVAIIEGDVLAIPERDILIADLFFSYELESISVYNERTYYSLKQAYELGIINYEQLVKIYEKYQIIIL